MAHYEELSALDASFLDLEDANTHMHIAAALVFDAGPLTAAHGGIDIDQIRAYIASRLHFVPRYRQRIAYTPVRRHPVWVDDVRFNLDYHVRHTSLPRPGDVRLFKRLCGWIVSQGLDRGKPLWEIWVVEGVEGGRFGLLAKIHHCMVDGASGVDLLSVLLTLMPEPTVKPPPRWIPRPTPSLGEFAAGRLYRHAADSIELLQKAGQALRNPRRFIHGIGGTAAGLQDAVVAGLGSASDTPLNLPVGPHRRFDWVHFQLQEAVEVKRRLGGTINDVILATVTGGLRRFLQGRGVRVDDLDFRVALPVSVRDAAEHGSLGNKLSSLVARLPLAERDPQRRLQSIAQMTARLKRSKQARGVQAVAQFSDWTATTVLTELMRLVSRLRAYNMVVTNVPGPVEDAYLLGAKMLEAYPLVPLYMNQGVGIALLSYAGGLHWGINADWETVPDLHDLVEDVVAAFDELRSAAVRVAAEARAKVSVARDAPVLQPDQWSYAATPAVDVPESAANRPTPAFR